MLKNYCRWAFAMIAVISFTKLHAQFNSSSDLPKKYRSVFLGFGPRSLNTEPGSIFTSFVDDSPSMDNFTGTFNVEDSYSRVGFILGYKSVRYNGLSHKFMFDIALGQHQGGLFTYALGYNFSRAINGKILSINPSIFGGFGNYGFEIGAIENNAGYIQIKDQQFYEQSLDLELVSQLFVFGPEININYTLNDHFEIWVNAAYDFASNNMLPQLRFQSENEGSAEVNIDSTNPYVTYNNEQIESLPYDASGMRFTVGASYVWNRY